MNKYPVTMSNHEYNAFSKIAKKLNMNVEDLVTYSVCKSFFLFKTTKEKRDKAVETYERIVEMLVAFSDVMHTTNNKSELFSDMQDNIYLGYDFLAFMEDYEDDFKIRVQNELKNIDKSVYGHGDIPGENQDGDKYYDDLIFENLDYFHTWNEHDILFLNSMFFSKYLHNRIMFPANEEIDTYELTLKVCKNIEDALTNLFGKTEFDESDSRELTEEEFVNIYNLMICRLFIAGEYVSSLVVSEEE